MTTEPTQDQKPPAPPAPGSHWARPGFLAAAGVVALVTTAAVAFAVFPPGHHNSPAPAGGKSPTAAVTPAAAKGNGSDSVCGLPAGDQTIPATAPASKWELVGTTAAPTAPNTYGPGNNGGLRSCFAHSPTGALYALVNYIALADDPSTAGAAINQLAAKGAGRDAALAEIAAHGTFPVDQNARIQVAGFAYLDYSPTGAVVDLATRVAASPGGESTLVHMPQTMRWQDGDWKFSPVPDAQNRTKALSDLNGYLVWSGA